MRKVLRSGREREGSLAGYRLTGLGSRRCLLEPVGGRVSYESFCSEGLSSCCFFFASDSTC